LHAEEMGRVAGEVMAKRIVMPPVVVPGVQPGAQPAPPAILPEEYKEFVWEETLAAGTQDREIKLGIDARAFNIRTDRELKVKFFREYVTIPSSESPFDVVFPTPVRRIYVTATAGAAVKMIASSQPIQVSFGRAKLEGVAAASFSSGQSYWYWASMVAQPAMSYNTWVAMKADGSAYVVPDGKRLVIDLVTLSTDVKGAVQQVDLLEYKSDGTLYRFGGAYFDCVVPLRLRVPLAAGSQVWIRTYNWDTDDRNIWVVINGFEEWS
jgi:hypothetical protein